MADFTDLGVKDIRDGVVSGEFTAREVAESFNAAVADAAALNAFIVTTPEHALAAADKVDADRAAGKDLGKMAGVPIGMKDLFATHGVQTTAASHILEGFKPDYESTVSSNLWAAGAGMLGKLNLDQFAMGSSNETSYFGNVNSPWRKEGSNAAMSPGGSSGGSSSAVASRIAPAATGTDTGGSIRQPAAFCGLVGMKQTYGAVSRYGLIAFGSSLDQIGPFSKTVAESAALLEAIGGHDPLDSTSIDQPAFDLTSVLDRGVEGMRIGILRELSGGEGGVEGLSTDVIARTNEAAAALEKAGATVVEVSVPSATLGLSAYYLVAPAEASSNLSRFDGVRYGLRVDAPTTGEMMTATRTTGFGPEVKRRIMLGTYALSAGYYDAFYGKALKVRTMMLQEFASVYADVDLLLTPTAPTTAFPLGDRTADPMTMYVNDVCTIPSNLVGHPAISVPFGVGDDGLPVGVQLLGPALSEPTIYQAAAALEAAAPGQGSLS